MTDENESDELTTKRAVEMAHELLEEVDGDPCVLLDDGLDIISALLRGMDELARERDAARAEAQGLRADAEVWRGATEITAEDGKSYMRATDATIARLRTALDAVAHAHELDLLRLAKALGFDHEPPSDVDAMVAAVEAQRAIIEGRTTPPTDAEIDAHYDGGGFWRVAGFLDMGDARDTKWYAASHRRFPSDERWWALDRDGRPCPWPSPARPTAGGGT